MIRKSGEGNHVGNHTWTTSSRKTKNVTVGQHHNMDTISIRKYIEEYGEQRSVEMDSPYIIQSILGSRKTEGKARQGKGYNHFTSCRDS